MVISQGVRKLIEEYKLWQKESEVREDELVISVDEVAARVASFYEKIRGIVDWREEHLLRKTAIERILKRRLAISRVNEDFAENFLSELVRGGHFPNNRISLGKVDEIQAIIEK
jgi:broad-specificity NMP kinase